MSRLRYICVHCEPLKITQTCKITEKLKTKEDGGTCIVLRPQLFSPQVQMNVTSEAPEPQNSLIVHNIVTLGVDVLKCVQVNFR